MCFICWQLWITVTVQLTLNFWIKRTERWYIYTLCLICWVLVVSFSTDLASVPILHYNLKIDFLHNTNLHREGSTTSEKLLRITWKLMALHVRHFVFYFTHFLMKGALKLCCSLSYCIYTSISFILFLTKFSIDTKFQQLSWRSY